MLVAGGEDWQRLALTYNTAELYDPSTGTFSPVPATMRNGRSEHLAVALPSGQVLIAGGIYSHVATTAYTTLTADLYDPVANAFV